MKLCHYNSLAYFLSQGTGGRGTNVKFFLLVYIYEHYELRQFVSVTKREKSVDVNFFFHPTSTLNSVCFVDIV